MAEEKLLGTQYLKLDRLRSDVGKANELLKSLGTGVELDFSDKIASQLKSQLDEIIKATKNAANTTKVLSSQMSSSVAGVSSKTGKQAQTDAQNISRLTSLYKQYYNTRAKLEAATQNSHKARTLSHQANDQQQQIRAVEALNGAYAKNQKVINAITEGKKKLAVAEAAAKDKRHAEAEAARAKKEAAEAAAQAKKEASERKRAADAVKETADAYRQLKTAYENYDKAVKRGDTESASYWNGEIEASKSVQASIEAQADALGLNESQRKKLNNLIQQSKDQESAHGQELDETASKTEQITNQMLRWVGTMVIMRGLTTLWRNATEYAGTYYDKLNEIRIVTGMSESESLKLGENYRQMAKDMKVSSTDIVSAATEFWRQGLPEDQVDARQVATTQYAKISGLAFEEAAELVTAATNSMNLDVQRVVDVFNYLGDASASGADEIGIAMQKASASANEAGVSFEWLGAYIATISEQTRQAPEVIGTSMNSIMARLHSIKQKGFNEEDETKINDVAKALDKVGVALMDQDGNWRDLSTIFIELSSVWGTLDDKTKAYLATTMAGTRQQNYFLALMNDMAKGVEGGSRAFELYEGAINSAGTTTQKYAVWMESVQAAQNGLTAEMEEFYSLLSADWMKGFYNSMAGIVAGINAGTDSMKGMNLVIPLVIAGIAGLAAAMTSAAGAAGVSTMSQAGLWAVMQAHPIALAVTAFAVLAGLMTGISSATQDASIDMGKAMDDMNKDITEQNTVQKTFTDNGREIENLKQRYIELAGKATLSATEQSELQSVMERIASISPALADAIRTTSGAFGAQAEVLRGLNAELEENYQYGLLSGQKSAREGFQSVASVIAGYNKQQEENKTQRLALDNYYSYRDKNFDKAGEGLFTKDGIQVTTQEMVEQYVLSVLSDAYESAPTRNTRSDYVDMAGKMQAANWGIDEGWWTELTSHFSATDTKAKRNSELISAIVDTVDNAELYGMQDQEKYNSAVNSVSAFLDAFKDTKGLSSPILDDANAKADAVFSEINWATTNSEELQKSLTLASQQYQSIFADAQKKQEELNASSEAPILQRDLDGAKAVFEADRTEENLNAYNALVRKWNENFGEYAKIEELSQDSIKKAEDATETTEESVGAAAEYANIVSKRMEAQAAAEQGYVNQLNAAKEAYSKDGFQGYRDYMDSLAESNKNLYEGMMDAYSEYDLANIYRGNIVGDEAIDALEQAIKKSDDVAKANTAYYQSVQKTAESTSTASAEAPEIQDYVSTLVSTLQTGYAEGGEQFGLDALISQIGTLGEEAEASLMAVAPWLPKLMDGTMTYGEVLKELNTLMTGTAENWTSFFEQLTGDTSAGTEEALAFIDRLTGMENDTKSIENFRTAWNALTDDAKESVYELIGTDMKEYLDEVVEGGEDSKEAFEKLRKEARKLRRENTAKYFKDTVKATYDLEDGTKTVEEAYADFRKEAERATEANEEYAAASEKVAEGTEVAAEDIQTLSDYLGMAPETIIKNWDVAGRMLANSLSEGEAALHALNEAAFINITGTSSADFSALSNGLMLVTAQAQDVVDALRATGQWELETIELPQEAKYWIPNADGTGGSWGTVTAKAGAKVLRYTGSKLGTSTGGNTSGGKTSGGGGGNSKVDNTADEKNLVDNMNWEIEAVDRRMAQLNAIMSKYETEGYLTGVINCLEMENELLEEQNALYQENIDTLDGKLGALRAELSKLTPGTAEYDDVLAQIEILQDAYGEYTQAILENEAALAENVEAMKEQREAIRDMEIDLREELLQAIEDRQEREEEALNARIEMEEKILDIIIRRHEKERDQILETTEMQIDALEREKDALDEALEARRQAAEEEDRALELKELEAQYARIIADPTRAKEALEIQKEIAELRDEIAWDEAEKEVEAQQESLDQQITSLDDYREYIEEYYEDLLENPRNFLEEVNEILSMSHEEVLAWLKQYSEDYTNSTDSARTEMENGWSDTLDTMNGIIRTHWEEIEKIISEGDDAIVEFLKDNSQDYKEAGELQAQAYVDAWVEQLEDLHKAYLDLKPELPDVKETNTTATSTSSGKSGGGGGGGNSGSSKKVKGYKIFSGSKAMNGTVYATEQEANSAIATAIKNRETALALMPPVDSMRKFATNELKEWKNAKAIAQYKTGGLASFTGPAWLDGSPSAPERVLSPYQTKLFENLVMSLQKVATINIPSLPFIASPEHGASGSYSFGDIVVNVDKLESDADYEEMARKVGEVILRQMNKGSYVGGIRYSF